MKLPDYTTAVIDVTKLREYCLNPRHPVGKHKARVFKAVLNMDQNDALTLKEKIQQGIGNAEASVSFKDQYGTRYIADIPIRHHGKSAIVATVWIKTEREETGPRLVTCYVKN